MIMKSKFNGDALHDDRIRIHQVNNRSVQLCVTDSQGRLMGIPSEDDTEICLPGISPGWGISVWICFRRCGLNKLRCRLKFLIFSIVVWSNFAMILITSNLGTTLRLLFLMM